MKCYISILFVIIQVLGSHAQISTSRVVYHAKHHFPGSNVFNGKNTLHFNKEHSIFIHNNYPIGNNVIETESNVITVEVGDKEGFPVYVDMTKSKIYSKVKGAMGGYSLVILEEQLDTINWVLTGEQKKIKEYHCLGAKTKYEGREYEVWFTPDIPVPFGPYRLRGLPGLILEANSLDNKVNWKFVGYESKTTEPYKLVTPSNGDKLTWEEFVTAKINYKIQMESRSNDEYTITIRNGNPNFYIEKGKFSIYKE